MNHLFREYLVSVSMWTELSIPNLLQESNLEFLQWLTWEVRKWKYPPGQSVKINFDGAYDGRLCQSASGIIAKNSKRSILLACSEIHQEVASAFVAEALACYKAAQIGIDVQWPKIIIEGDLLSIIKKCNAKIQDKSHVGAYIHDIQQITSKSRHFRLVATESLKKKEEIYLFESIPGYTESQKDYDRVRELD
ncbi:hypothetical protein CXB51_008415 [Gossypium anomalum]|uniref:RNase H type-1 domain-containing protein n=1 Tax=Gossypium anomalum TaxID=47600 RepID=A0A8J5Z933_9ROSI|nr:hypothetical protein CXB51_008415 [Gossypium anomalum]